MQADLSLLMIGYLLKTTLQMGTPIILAALGGMFSEKAGIVNIGLEGMMLTGAFTAVVVTAFTGNPWLGLLIGAGAGGLLSLVHAIMCVKFKGNHIVSGTGMILLGFGITTLGLQVVWGIRGRSDEVTGIDNVVLEGLQGVPVLGTAFSSLSPVIYLMFIIVIACWYVIYKTPFGLRLRAAGEDPSTLDTAGVNVDTYRIIGVLLSGVLAGLGGAYLSVGYENAFAKNMTNGRGFIGLAAMIFGNWTPIGCLLAGLFFGFLGGLEYALQIGLGNEVVGAYLSFIQMLPYILVVVALAGIRKSVPPKAVGIPYETEKHG
ncbi:MAG: ABC transporter permease [Candidatus Thorarchaeota archaeon]|nr:ABC transporter permease [Candidatus Thorarchaeota archaeon]